MTLGFSPLGVEVWTSVEMGRPPPKRRDPKGRNVSDFTCSHEAAGSGSSLCFRFRPHNGKPRKTIGTVAYTRNTFSRVAQGD